MRYIKKADGLIRPGADGLTRMSFIGDNPVEAADRSVFR